MKREIVTSTRFYSFSTRIKELSAMGYRIVPGTLSTSGLAHSGADGFFVVEMVKD